MSQPRQPVASMLHARTVLHSFPPSRKSSVLTCPWHKPSRCRPRAGAWALKCPFYSLIAPLARWFIDIAREHVVASTQARQSRLRDDGLDEDGDKLFEHAPGAGPGQAAASTGGESSSSSTSGSSKRMMRR